MKKQTGTLYKCLLQNVNVCLMLSWKDSNPHKQNQNLRCYHYTTRQSERRRKDRNLSTIATTNSKKFWIE